MYQIIVYGTIGMVTLACAAIFIDWDKIGQILSRNLKAPEDNS